MLYYVVDSPLTMFLNLGLYAVMTNMKYLALKNYVFGYSSRIYSQAQKEEFYRQFLNETDLHGVLSLLQKSECSTAQTQQSVTFQNLLFGASMRLVGKKLGRVRYTHAVATRRHKYDINVYKKKVGGYVIFYVCHFLNNQLFMVQSTCPNMSGNLKELFMAQLEIKYKVRLAVGSDHCIADGKGNRLLLLEQVYTNSYYISGNAAYANKLFEELELTQLKAANKYGKVLSCLM